MCTTFKDKFWKQVREFKDEFWRQVREFFVGLTIKIPVLGVIVLILGIFSTGDWIKCKFFESNACLPKLTIVPQSEKLGLLSLTTIDQEYRNYRIINRLLGLEKYLVHKNKILIEKRGEYAIGGTNLKVTFLDIGPTKGKGIWIGYRIDHSGFKGNVNAVNEITTVKQNGIKIEPFHFSEKSVLGYQEAKIFILAAYPKELDTMEKADLFLVSISCENCRDGYKEVFKTVRIGI